MPPRSRQRVYPPRPTPIFAALKGKRNLEVWKITDVAGVIIPPTRICIETHAYGIPQILSPRF